VNAEIEKFQYFEAVLKMVKKGSQIMQFVAIAVKYS